MGNKQKQINTKQSAKQSAEQELQAGNDVISLDEAARRYTPDLESAQKAQKALDEMDGSYLHIEVRKKKIHVEFELPTRTFIFLLTASTAGGLVLKALGA